MRKLLLLVLLTTYLVAGCRNDLIGKFTINEVFKPQSSGLSMAVSEPFIELTDTDIGDGVDFNDTWSVKLTIDGSSTVYSLDADECEEQEYIGIALDDKDELDFEDGMSISLYDGDGNFIDYLVLQGNDVEGKHEQCSWEYDSQISFDNDTGENRDLYRDPDKTGDWLYEEQDGVFMDMGGGDGSKCNENNTVGTIFVNDDADSYDANNTDSDCDDANFDNIPDALQKVRDNDSADAPFKIKVCTGDYDLGSDSLEFDHKNFNGFVIQGEGNNVNLTGTADRFFNINHRDIEKITFDGMSFDHDVSCDSTCDNSRSIFGFTKNKNNADSKFVVSRIASMKSGCRAFNFNSNFGGAYTFRGFGAMESDCTPFEIDDCSSDDKFTFKSIFFNLTSSATDQFGLFFSDNVDDTCDVDIEGISLDMEGSSGIRFYELNDFKFESFIFKNSGDDAGKHAFYVEKPTGINYTFKYFDINASGQAFYFNDIEADTTFTLDGDSSQHSIISSRNTHGFTLPGVVRDVNIINTDIYPNTGAAIDLEVTGDFNLAGSISSSEDGVILREDFNNLTINNSSVTSNDDIGIKLEGELSNEINIDDLYIQAKSNAFLADKTVNGDIYMNNIDFTSDDTYTIYFKDPLMKNLTIENSKINAKEEVGIYIYNGIEEDLKIKSTQIVSKQESIYLKNKVNGNFIIDNSDINSTNYMGVSVKKGIAKDFNITNSSIYGLDYGVYIYDAIQGDINIKDTNISSTQSYTLNIDAVDGYVAIDKSDINSTQNIALYFQDDILGGATITASSISGSEYGAYVKENDIILDISDSNFTSINQRGLYSESKKRLTIEGSCIMSTDYEYALQIYTTDSNSKISNNCFKSTNVNDTAYSSQSGVNFSENSWYDWGDGDYSNSHNVADSGTKRCSLGCYEDEAVDINFTIIDSFRNSNGDIEDLNISTKIIGTEFDLNISSVDADNNITDFNGTICYQIQDANQESTWLKYTDFNRSEIVTVPDSNVTFISKDSWIFMKWHENKSEADTDCTQALDGNTSSKDNFSIRPKEYFINLSSSTVKAGSDFDLTFLAGKDNNTPSHDYNETNGGSNPSFDLNTSEQNQNCIEGVFNPDITIDVDFTDGSKEFTDITYSEVGFVDINISEDSKTCSERYASIDCDDKNITGYWNTDNDLSITPKVETLRVTPHHFNVDIVSTNFKGGNFTYLAKSDLTKMSASVDINITAQNENNKTTQNYSRDCYAQKIKIDYNYTSVDENLSEFLYYYEFSDNNSTDNNVTINDTVSDDVNKTNFSTDNNGSAIFKINYNFKRDRSTPINPFDINITDFSVIDTNATDVNGIGEDSTNANFCFGRTKTGDITTTKEDINHTIEIEVYDDAESDYTRTFNQNSLSWYQHENHNRVIDGNVSEINATTTSTLDNIVFSVSDIKSPNNGDIEITISNKTADTFYMHQKTRAWLWHTIDGYGDDYNVSDGSSCSEHPCFKYTLDEKEKDNNNTISSGTYQGGDSKPKDKGDTTRVGVKVYR